MRKYINVPNSLVLINVLALALILAVGFLPQNALRIALGLPFMLVFPGYALMLAVFPKKDSLRNTERAALSFGLSIMAIILIGLAMHYTPWGLGALPILLALSIFTLASSITAYFRWRRLPLIERAGLSADPVLTRWTGLSRLNKTLSGTSVILLLAIIGVLGYGYSVVIPKQGEQYSEFYIAAPGGQVDNYLSELKVGQQAVTSLGVVNHERQETLYRIDITIDGIKSGEPVSLRLSSGEQAEPQVSFTPLKSAPDQKLEFLLYKDGATEPYATLYLFVDAE